MSDAAPQTATRAWCGQCGLPVLVNEDAQVSTDRVVHEASGSVLGYGGHFADLVADETGVMRAAREIREEYGKYMDVDLLYGALVAVHWKMPQALTTFEDVTAEALRAKIEAVAPGTVRKHAARVRKARSTR